MDAQETIDHRPVFEIFCLFHIIKVFRIPDSIYLRFREIAVRNKLYYSKFTHQSRGVLCLWAMKGLYERKKDIFAISDVPTDRSIDVIRITMKTIAS